RRRPERRRSAALGRGRLFVGGEHFPQHVVERGIVGQVDREVLGEHAAQRVDISQGARRRTPFDIPYGEAAVPKREPPLGQRSRAVEHRAKRRARMRRDEVRSEEHTSELQSREKLVCRLLLEKKKPQTYNIPKYGCYWRYCVSTL